MKPLRKDQRADRSSLVSRGLLLCLALYLTMGFLVAGCHSSNDYAPTVKNTAPSKTGPVQPDPLVLREGDAVRIEFPGAPNLNTRETIKRDGKISLLKGEIVAAGKTVSELQKDVLDLYSPDLITKVVVVSVESAAFPIYVTGAVGHTGQLMVDRPLTVLQAVMQAGVDLSRANLKGVRLSRTTNGHIDVYLLNLDDELKGRNTTGKPLYVVPSDIIYVPEKFQWF